MRNLIVPFCLAATLSACATDNNAPQTSRDEPEFVTGSNIPRRDRSASSVRVISPEEYERMRNSPGAIRSDGTK